MSFPFEAVAARFFPKRQCVSRKQLQAPVESEQSQ